MEPIQRPTSPRSHARVQPNEGGNTLATGQSGAQGGVLPSRGHKSRRLPETPPRQALIVQLNMREVHAQRHAQALELRGHVERLLADVSHLPDALLLPEAHGEDARRLARLLSEATGRRFGLAVGPGSAAGRPGDPAVILNFDTLKVEEPAGWLRRGEPDQPATPFVHVVEAAGGLRLSLACVRFLHEPGLASAEAAGAFEARKTDWLARVAAELAEGHRGKPHHGLIGGDFHDAAEATPAMNVLTGSFGYMDVFAGAGCPALYSQAPALTARGDKGADGHDPQRVFQWALVTRGPSELDGLRASMLAWLWQALRRLGRKLARVFARNAAPIPRVVTISKTWVVDHWEIASCDGPA